MNSDGATTIFGVLLIRTDALVPGTFRLSLDGETNAFHVWASSPPGGSPLPVAGGGADGSAFGVASPAESDTDLFVEAVSNGTATLTYAFAGTGSASNLACSAALRMTAFAPDIDVDTDNNGVIDTTNGGEDLYEEYAPGLLITVTNSAAEGAGYRYPVLLSTNMPPFPGVMRLSQSGDGAVRVWGDLNDAGSVIALPKTWNVAQGEKPPGVLWVDGVAEGTVTLTYAAVESGGLSASADRVRLTVIPPASYAPGGGSFAAIWAPLYTMSNANDENNLGWSDGAALANEISMQGFTNVVWYKDTTGDTDLDLGDCTYANYLNMRNAGAVCVTASHGNFGTHLAVYAPYTAEGEALIENWCTNHSGMICQERRPNPNDPLNPGYFFAEVSGTWLSANWKTALDARHAIVSWNICRSATGTATFYSVKEAAGGRWRIGYADATTGFEGSWVNQTFFRYMNGKNGEGLRRTTGAAYGDGSEYPANVRMSGNPWTTLAPAHIPANAWMPISLFPLPGSSASFGKGWGCVIFDTYLDDTASAASAIQQLSGSTISDVRWVQLGAGKRAIGFKYDKTGGEGIQLRLVPGEIRNLGASGGRPTVKRDDSWSSGYLEWGF